MLSEQPCTCLLVCACAMTRVTDPAAEWPGGGDELPSSSRAHGEAFSAPWREPAPTVSPVGVPWRLFGVQPPSGGCPCRSPGAARHQRVIKQGPHLLSPRGRLWTDPLCSRRLALPARILMGCSQAWLPLPTMPPLPGGPPGVMSAPVLSDSAAGGHVWLPRT